MLILSASMPKAGSAWYTRMTNDLLVAAGHDDNVAVREACGLGDLLKWNTCHLSRLSDRKLGRLLRASEQGYTYCVHAHCGPTRSVRRNLGTDKLRATYIFRDPRDVVISSYQHGVRERAAGRRWANFSKLRSIDTATYWVLLRHLPRYSAWERLDSASVHLTRYEDLVADTRGELIRLARFLDVSVSRETIGAIGARYAPRGGLSGQEAALHFHRGVPGRFQDELSADQIRRCNRLFAGYLARMGYEG